LIDNTKFVDHFLAKILSWQYLNPRRKASSIDRSDFASYIALFLITPDTDKKIALLKKTKLDRGVLAAMTRLWLKTLEPYEKLLSDPKSLDPEYSEAEEREIEVKVSLKPDHSLYGAYQQAKYWWTLYQSFKNSILEKYTRLCLTKAQQDYVMFQHRVHLHDVIQIYLMNASKAIDKCDTERGVLTTHIQNWLKHARNQVMTSHFNDVAYSLPKNSKTLVKNMAEANTVSFEELDEFQSQAHQSEVDEDREDRITRVRYIAKVFDPRGIGRLCLGIQETLSQEERQTLRALAVTSLPSVTVNEVDSKGTQDED
jgi:hypothetical protein